MWRTTTCCPSTSSSGRSTPFQYPACSDGERITVNDLGYADDGIVSVSARFGYIERPNVPRALRLVFPRLTEGPIDIDHASYFVSHVDLCAGPQPSMAPWRTRLFIATSYIAADAAAYFGLPVEQTVIIGARIQI